MRTGHVGDEREVGTAVVLKTWKRPSNQNVYGYRFDPLQHSQVNYYPWLHVLTQTA